MSEVKLNQLEYCYLVEDTAPDAMEMKIHIPKLMQNIPPSNKNKKNSVNTNVLMNEDKAALKVSSTAETQNYILAKVQDPYAHEHKHHNCQGKVGGSQNNCPNTSHSCTCPGSSILKPCPHFHHDHHFPHLDDYGKIPAGAKMICLIMDGNIKDIYVTRMLCKF